MAKSRRNNHRSKRKKSKQSKKGKEESYSELYDSNGSNDGVSTASNIGKGLIQFVLYFITISAILFGYISKDRDTVRVDHSSISNAIDNSTQPDNSILHPTHIISKDSFVTNESESQLSLFGITDHERIQYHPVVKFPYTWVKEKRKTKIVRKKVYDYTVLDLTTNDNHEVESEPTSKKSSCNLFQRLSNKCKLSHMFAVGKYDENRIGLYTTPLFQNSSNTVDGYQGQRTIHMGIDLFGPVGHKVFAFADGVVHSAGYNAALGDYGHVIVLEHEVGHVNNTKQNVWALYGHLDANSIKGKHVGKTIRKGQLVGRMGDVHDNGGWPNPHVHFQLSIHPPETHDMPGVVSKQDRQKAIIHYPDPRIVLGQLY